MNKSSSIIFAFLFLTFTFSIFGQEKNCNCEPASEVDVALGGNMIITYTAGKVKQIRGITTFVDETTFEDVVVEVYEVTKEEEKNINENAWRIPGDKKRKIACITGKDGKFCFKNLSKGIYVLRIGTNTRDNGWFNHVFVIVELDPKNGKNKEIKVGLEVAT